MIQMLWVELLVSGIMLGGVYALLALGLNLIFGVMGVVNFAHGEFLMIGAMLTAWLSVTHGVNPIIGTIAAVLVMGIAGGFVHRTLIERLTTVPPVMSLLATYGLSIILVNVAYLIWGGSTISVSGFLKGSIDLGIMTVPSNRALTFAVATLATLCLYLFLRFNALGKSLRAVSQDQTLAVLCGVNARLVRVITFAIGSALAGLAGGLLTILFTADFQMGERFVIKAFAIIIIGGLGSFPGALLGGLMVGIVEVVGSYVTAPTAANALIYLLMIAILLFRPKGLLGVRSSI